jgi:hypothetical protein
MRRVCGESQTGKGRPLARRFLARDSMYERATGTEALKIGGVTVQILRDWV